ncbi:Extracellular exo-alpha-(1-_5)-L-arabinofuranosidase precursor [Rubripirellula lacrimiformis]|uniref:Extracellular exo-alpha-(1->5)-L-arabinofuranosidase n=1 Tax=Rubripirellula lacrimiformis TaxID=1930273 RepID=A0A517NA45_9BACT|nr:sulfatase-like hydrolase/transferase [Rubripirellula lacrimiformis]QDT04004.1 Extracellular exo-alpha-(1->5)-L-arabinofuranosidase precursor [Rubripirellula lacrimiformis]
MSRITAAPSLLLALLVGLCFTAATNVSFADKRPNVVTVFIDDMGWSDLSCFGGTRTTTENVDALAAEGLRFSNFYVNSPICSPSRVALSTGQYPQRWKISSYLASRKLNRERGMAQWLDLKAPMLAGRLQQSGYATGHFGKWHMGGQRDVGEAPLITEYGFDRSLTNFEGLGPRVLPLKDAFDGKPPQKHDLGSGDLGRGPIQWQDRSVVTATFVDDAIGFINEAAGQNKPFFVNVWPDDVHSPFFPPEVLRDETDGSKRALYFAVLDAMDQQLAKLFDRIRNDEKLRDNTLILVMSDNGHEEGAGSSDPLRGAKTWLYEGGVRSPLIVWGPGLLADEVAGTTNDQSVLCAMDVNRSLYSITGTPVPESVVFDGEDLSETLLGKTTQSRNDPIFWRRPPDRPGTSEADNPDLAVRDGKWKYLVNYDDSEPQLYELVADPSEVKNLADQRPQVAQRLHQSLIAWNAAMPADAGDPRLQDPQDVGSISPDLFINPIGEGADPWVIRDPNQPRYLWCTSHGNQAISIHSSDRLTSLGKPHTVWTAPQLGPVSAQVWAPELHFMDGRWYVYFAASDGDNANHLAYVLESLTEDPLGQYTLHGPLATGDGDDGMSPNTWAIDMTVLTIKDKRFAIWSGWDVPGSDQQYLYIAPMESPTKLAGPRIRLTNNSDHPWELTENGDAGRGLNEAPQVFQAKGKTFVTYSCGASWLPTYKLGILELTGEDPLDPDAWHKRPRPVFQGTHDVFGVGHSCFVKSIDGKQWWHIFHAKRDRKPGWRRAIYVQPMSVGKKGFPLLGKPIRAGKPTQRPSGEHVRQATLPIRLFGDQDTDSDWSYYAHHQSVDRKDDGLHLGVVTGAPVNHYPSGEKIVLDSPCPDDFIADATIDFNGNADARDAGILFRCTGPSVGFDAQRGYFAGIIPATGLVVVGKTNGTSWTEIARARSPIDVAKHQNLRVQMIGDQITVAHNGRHCLSVTDDTYASGTVGLRVVNTHAVFSDLKINGTD